jgi:hypothetical protein
MLRFVRVAQKGFFEQQGIEDPVRTFLRPQISRWLHDLRLTGALTADAENEVTKAATEFIQRRYPLWEQPLVQSCVKISCPRFQRGKSAFGSVGRNQKRSGQNIRSQSPEKKLTRTKKKEKLSLNKNEPQVATRRISNHADQIFGNFFPPPGRISCNL